MDEKTTTMLDSDTNQPTVQAAAVRLSPDTGVLCLEDMLATVEWSDLYFDDEGELVGLLD